MGRARMDGLLEGVAAAAADREGEWSRFSGSRRGTGRGKVGGRGDDDTWTGVLVGKRAPLTQTRQ